LKLYPQRRIFGIYPTIFQKHSQSCQKLSLRPEQSESVCGCGHAYMCCISIS
jgi:hypothetical protein